MFPMPQTIRSYVLCDRCFTSKCVNKKLNYTNYRHLTQLNGRDSHIEVINIIELTNKLSYWQPSTVLWRQKFCLFADICCHSISCWKSNDQSVRLITPIFRSLVSLTSTDMPNWGCLAFSAFLGRPLTTCNIQAMLLWDWHHDGRTFS